MKNLLLLLSLFIYADAHECHYKLDIEINDTNITGKATIKSDHPSLELLNSNANISKIQNGSLKVINNIATIIKKDPNKELLLSFTNEYKKINNDTILLNSWYPKINMLCSYETTLHNNTKEIVIESEHTTQENNTTTYFFDKPTDSLHLIASDKYIKDTLKTKDITLNTYLYKEDAILSGVYIQKMKEYFKRYKTMFGFIPYTTFSVAETPFPAGYSMATFTLIGQQIINKDFVLENSLGHEILHQWFGNYIYTPLKGNWGEGLTTFYSDYLYAQENHTASKYRKNLLLKYDAYVNTQNEIPLIAFSSKGHESKNAIGYAKATFFFVMLEKKIGKNAFNEGVKLLLQKYAFKVATYKNLREIFEKTSGKKLLEFFKTWVYKKGTLQLKLQNTKLKFIKDRYVLTFDIQTNIKEGEVPLSICDANECLYTHIDLQKNQQSFELDIEPTKMVIDENYTLFRELQTDEVPPLISKVLSASTLLILDRKTQKKFSKFKKMFQNIRYPDTVTYKELKENNVLVLGSTNALLNQLAIKFKMEGDTTLEVYKNPLNEKNILAVFDMNKLSQSVFYKLKHLGNYSRVVFKDGNTLSKSIKKSNNGMVYKLVEDSLVLKPNAKKLSSIIDDIAKNKVVFIGEKHTQFSSHLNQLKIIKAMYTRNKKLAIGMEMFQQQFQNVLDKFIAHKITEKEMLIQTEYFKRWKYDYELYRPILLFAQKHHIKIVALNIDREITKKVVSNGLDFLSMTQKAQLPKSIDFTNDAYKNYLQMVFGMHHSQKFKNFEEFYHAQLIWDEVMAKNIVQYLTKHPSYSMAVLAGNGHIMHGYGIPSRVKRGGIDDYIITLNMTNPQSGIADYLLYPSNITTIKAKKIGFYPKSKIDLEVIEIAKNSLAQKANIQVGDKVVAVNGIKVKNLYDLKTQLVFVEGKTKITLKRGSSTINTSIDFSSQ